MKLSSNHLLSLIFFHLTLNSSYGQPSTTDTTVETCGSLFVSVDIISLNSTETLVSASTQFPPFSYSLFDETELVPLDDNDNLCNQTTIINSNTYDGSVILVMVDESECSAQYQVNTAYLSGAIGVIFYNNQDDTQVYHLNADNTTQSPNIPARMISQLDGEELKNDIDNGNVILIRLTCEDGSYAQTVCVFDSDGDHWELDGDYEAQTDLQINGHPVWLKRGYFSIYKTRYLWLDTNKWRWVISNSTSQDNSTQYRHDEAYCSVTTLNNTVDPSICEDWRILLYSGGVVTGEISNDLVVRGAICEISDHYFCLTSGKNGLSDYEGTYHQQHDSVPLWTREDVGTERDWSYIIQEDYTWCRRNQGGGSQFTCTNYTNSFVMYNEDYDPKAICVFENSTKSIGTIPEDCTPWYSISTDPRNGQLRYNEDTTLDIDEGWCSGYLNTPNTTQNFDNYPNELCLNNNNNSYYSESQYLYGTFKMVEGDSYGNAPIWTQVRLDNTSYERYIFLDDQDDIWILDNHVPNDEDSTIRDPNGECYAENIDDPTLCEKNGECWDIERTQDCSIWNLTAGPCPNETVVGKEAYIEYICVTFQDNEGFRSTHANGLYSLSDDMINGRYYYSFTNTTSDRTFYIYYYDILKYWIYSEGIYNDNDDFNEIGLYCIEYNEYNLLECNWQINDERYDRATEYDWEIHSCPNGTYKKIIEVAPTEMPNPSPTRFPTISRPTRSPIRSITTTNNRGGQNNNSSNNNNGLIIGLSVTLTIAALLLIGVGIMYFGRRKKGTGGFGSGFDEQVDDDIGDLPLSDLGGQITQGGTGGTIGRTGDEELSLDDDQDEDEDEPENNDNDNSFDGPNDETGQD